MKGRLFDIFAVLSALVCVAAAGMWVRSYRAEDMYRRADSPRDPATAAVTQLSSNAGGVMICRLRTVWLGPNAVASAERLRQYRRGWSSRPAALLPVMRMPLPGAKNFATKGTTHQSEDFIVAVPYWLIMTVSAALPGWRVMHFARRRRPPGACRSCGYDLRASEESGRCPECGKAFAAGQ